MLQVMLHLQLQLVAVHVVRARAIRDDHMLELRTQRCVAVDRIGPLGAGRIDDALHGRFDAVRRVGVGVDALDRIRHRLGGGGRPIHFGGEQFVGCVGDAIDQTGDVVVVLLLLDATVMVRDAARNGPVLDENRLEVDGRIVQQLGVGCVRVVLVQVQMQRCGGRSAVRMVLRHLFVSIVVAAAAAAVDIAIVRLVHGFANAQPVAGGLMQQIALVFALVVGLRMLHRDAGLLNEFVFFGTERSCLR